VSSIDIFVTAIKESTVDQRRTDSKVVRVQSYHNAFRTEHGETKQSKKTVESKYGGENEPLLEIHLSNHGHLLNFSSRC